MKKYLVMAVALVLVSAGAAMAATSGSKHDIAGYLWSGGTKSFLGANATNQNEAEICVYCHTPHAANTFVKSLLWNKTGTTQTTFSAYSMVSATTGVANNPGDGSGSITKLCLSCHDGSQAVYAMGNTPNYYGFITGNVVKNNVDASGKISGAPQLTGDFSNDHPIDFDYSIAATAENTRVLGSLRTVLGNTAPLSGGKMVCSTCHDVHNTVGVTDSALLRMSNKGSALCSYCHSNK